MTCYVKNRSLKVNKSASEFITRLTWAKIGTVTVKLNYVNIELRSTRGWVAWTEIFISFKLTAQEQAQSNRPCNIFILVVFGGF
jgi:hypothetical protein